MLPPCPKCAANLKPCVDCCTPSLCETCRRCVECLRRCRYCEELLHVCSECGEQKLCKVCNGCNNHFLRCFEHQVGLEFHSDCGRVGFCRRCQGCRHCSKRAEGTNGHEEAIGARVAFVGSNLALKLPPPGQCVQHCPSSPKKPVRVQKMCILPTPSRSLHDEVSTDDVSGCGAIKFFGLNAVGVQFAIAYHADGLPEQPAKRVAEAILCRLPVGEIQVVLVLRRGYLTGHAGFIKEVRGEMRKRFPAGGAPPVHSARVPVAQRR